MTQQRGTVSKRSGSWGFRATFTDDMGQRRYVSKYSKKWTQKDAQRELTAALAHIDAGHELGDGTTTVETYLNAWFAEWANLDNVKRSTIDTTRCHLDAYIIPHLGHIRMRELKPGRIAAFYTKLRTEGRTGGKNGAPGTSPLSTKTVRNVAGTLHKALKDGVRRGVLGSNPCDKVDVPKYERPPLQTYDVTQVAQFLAYTERTQDPAHALWRLLLVTGLRRGELLGLEWDDVDLVLGEINVHRTRTVNSAGSVYVDTPKTAAGRRWLTIDAGTVDALARLKDAQEHSADTFGVWTSPYVATDPDGQPIHPLAITRRFQAIARKAGLPVIRLHDGRHTALTLALDAGVPMHVVSKRAGHSRVSTTLDTYSHRHHTADRDASDRIAAALESATKEAEKCAQNAHEMRTVDAETDELDTTPNQQNPMK